MVLDILHQRVEFGVKLRIAGLELPQFLDEDNAHDERKRQIESHHQSLHGSGLGTDHTAFGTKLNYPHDSHTRPNISSTGSW